MSDLNYDDNHKSIANKLYGNKAKNDAGNDFWKVNETPDLSEDATSFVDTNPTPYTAPTQSQFDSIASSVLNPESSNWSTKSEQSANTWSAPEISKPPLQANLTYGTDQFQNPDKHSENVEAIPKRQPVGLGSWQAQQHTHNLRKPPTEADKSAALDAMALAVSPVPVVGDAIGFANDVRHFVTEPESRTPGNYALSLAGLAPWVPPMAGIVRQAKKLGMELSPAEVYDFKRPTWYGKGQDTMSVFRNPTKDQVNKSLKEGKYMRVLRNKENNDIYAWPGEEGLHADIAKQLDLSEDAVENLGYLQSFEDLEEVLKYMNDGSGQPRFHIF
jgi:hypothetical protein